MSKEIKNKQKEIIEEQESTLYFFYTQGCGWCKKVIPIIDELNKEGYNILQLDLADGDNKKLQAEVKEEYKHQCGTPYFVDGETGNTICGFKEKDIIEKWAKGEKIPQPVKPKGQMPKPPFMDSSKKEEDKWKKEYTKWYKENDKLPNIKTADEILEMPRPKSEPPKLANIQAMTDKDIDKWGEEYDKWAKENKHLPKLQPKDQIVSRLKQQKNQMATQNKPSNTLNPDQEARLSRLEQKIDKLMKHLGVK
tara:strand:+ start:2201 stop:2953 length:753 start_codon:yes stop_codon:yes gene_type:complete